MKKTTLLPKMPAFNVLFEHYFLRNAVKFLHRQREKDKSYPQRNYKYLVSIIFQGYLGLKMPVFLNSTNFCTVLKPFSNKRSYIFFHATNNSQQQNGNSQRENYFLVFKLTVFRLFFSFSRIAEKTLVQMTKNGVFRPGFHP